MGTLVCHMEYPASFFLACTNFSLGRTACRELAYTLCCPVLAETLKVAKKKVYCILAISCNSRVYFGLYLCVVLI